MKQPKPGLTGDELTALREQIYEAGKAAGARKEYDKAHGLYIACQLLDDARWMAGKSGAPDLMAALRASVTQKEQQ